eukprot:3089527-Rhodomonas_salina.2
MEVAKLEQELLLAEKSEDTLQQIKSLNKLGAIHQTLGAGRRCVTLQCSQLVNLGNVCNTLRQSAAAIKVFEKALDMAQHCQTRNLQGVACLGLGRAKACS